MDTNTIPVKAFVDLNGDVTVVHYSASKIPTYGRYFSNIGAFCTVANIIGNSRASTRHIWFFKKESDNQVYVLEILACVRYDDINGVRGVDVFEVSKYYDKLDNNGRRLINNIIEWEKNGDYTFIESLEEVVVRDNNNSRYVVSNRYVVETLYLLRNIENILENAKVDNSYYMFDRRTRSWNRGINSPRLLRLDKYRLAVGNHWLSY